MFINDLNSKVSPLKPAQGKEIKILSPTQVIQKLRITLAQVKAGGPSENLLDETCHIRYSVLRAKKLLEDYKIIKWTQCKYNTNWKLSETVKLLEVN